jgi:Fic family protein
MANLGEFSPLLPEDRVGGPLLEKAAQLIRDSGALTGPGYQYLSAPLKPLLRAMNSYYSNKIEGQHTHPADIERALRQQFDADEAKARKQRIAIAHMEVEAEQEEKYAGADPRILFDPAVVAGIHASLFAKLSARDRVTEENEPVSPGKWRTKGVKVGRHVPPSPKEVPGFMEGWAKAYAAPRGNEALLVGAACSHHRLAWIHPFIDGNGRVARLHTHLVLHAMGLTGGLWSPMRGLARQQQDYYARLNNADLPRRNDLDGRGSLSQEELVKFAAFFLDVCLDQVAFMKTRLRFDAVKEGLADLLRHLAEHPWKFGSQTSVIRPSALAPLHYVAVAGPIPRTEFLRMIGEDDRTSRVILASLIHYGILEADSHVGSAPVRLALPQKSLRFLFPNLWPEVETDKPVQ